MKKISKFVQEYYLITGMLLMSLYFTYHIFYSNRGYLTLLEVNNDIDQSVLISQETEIYKKNLAHKVDLLSDNNFDMDMIDEMIRTHLNMASKDEYVILK